jgi:hypothetical protein
MWLTEVLQTTTPQGKWPSVRAWTALRPSGVESRFEALHASGLTELVGREEELELLLRRWSKAKTGEGQVVLLSGEAGIGKSRLTAALLENIGAEPHTRLRYFCSPQHTDSPLYPIIGQMGRVGRFVHDDTAQARLDKLDMMLAQTSTSKEDAALCAEMLSLANDGRYPVLELASEQRRQRTLEALVSQVDTFEGSVVQQLCPAVAACGLHLVVRRQVEEMAVRRARKGILSPPSMQITVPCELNGIAFAASVDGPVRQSEANSPRSSANRM